MPDVPIRPIRIVRCIAEAGFNSCLLEERKPGDEVSAYPARALGLQAG
jgi:hypothetical protein